MIGRSDGWNLETTQTSFGPIHPGVPAAGGA